MELETNEITNFDRIRLDADIDRSEIKKALWGMKINKVPGIDGLPVEFYKFFWPNISELVSQAIMHASKHGFIINTRRGLISLMEKPDRDLLDIKNWRPLSLLNVDYKIFSKILAKRLASVLPQIIHQDQSGFMKGRSMHENIANALTAMNYCKKGRYPGPANKLRF